MENTRRACLEIGMWVDIVLKKDQPTGKLTRGQIKRLLTNIAVHPRGIKVMLMDNQVGRVQRILSKTEILQEKEKFYEGLFHLPSVFSIYDLNRQRFEVFRYTNPVSNQIERTALLFEKKEELEQFVEGTKYEEHEYIIKPIQKDESIVNKFLPLFVEYFRINGMRKIGVSSFIELERKYRAEDEEDFLI